jgi:hypothetical protein
MDPARGTAIATLSRALVFLVQSSEMDARIAAIEATFEASESER